MTSAEVWSVQKDDLLTKYFFLFPLPACIGSHFTATSTAWVGNLDEALSLGTVGLLVQHQAMLFLQLFSWQFEVWGLYGEAKVKLISVAANFVAQLEALPVHLCFIISSSLGAVAYKLPAALQPCPCPTGCSEQRPLWEPEQGTEHHGGSSRMNELCQPRSHPDTEAPDTGVESSGAWSIRHAAVGQIEAPEASWSLPQRASSPCLQAWPAALQNREIFDNLHTYRVVLTCLFLQCTISNALHKTHLLVLPA